MGRRKATNEQLLLKVRREQERRGLLPRSIDKRDVQLRTFMRWLGDRSILAASREDVEGFLDGRHIGARTRYTYLSHFHGFYRWAIAEDLCSEDPTAKIVRPRMRRALPRPASSADLRRLLELAGPKERCWVMLAAYQGLRCQEIAGLRREDVLETEGLLRVTHAKGGNERMLPLHQDVLAALHVLPMPRVGWMFTRPRGGRYHPETVSVEFNSFLRAHGIPATAHQLRHWFGTHLYRQSRDLRLTQEMMGHASPTTTSIYTAFDRRAAGEAVRSLGVELPTVAQADPDEAA